MDMNSATIKLFLLFGDPNRLRTAEISNWSGTSVATSKPAIRGHFKTGQRTAPRT